jgi:hypothetical protein
MRDTEGQKHTKRFRKRGTEIDIIGRETGRRIQGERERERERERTGSEIQAERER